MKLFLSPQFSKPSNANEKERPLSPQSSLKSTKVVPAEVQKGPLSSFVLDENTSSAEIIWYLNVVKSPHCFRSCDLLKNLFKVMFPDSAILGKFSLGKDKARYMNIYGIFLAFKQKLKSMNNNSPWYSVSFDESLNKNQQKCQMDGCKFKILGWRINIAETSYLGSKFLLRPNVENLKYELVPSITGLDMAKFLKLSMDGPSTNWNILNVVSNHLVANGYKNLIEIGSCSVHTVHDAFQTGATFLSNKDRESNKAFEAMYKIFNESSAGHDVYLKEENSSKFPIKFCETGWIEDKEIAEHALEFWESVVGTVRYRESLC